MYRLLAAILFIAMSSHASEEVCTNGGQRFDPKQAPKDLTGSIYCLDPKTNYPVRMLSYRDGKLVQAYAYEGMKLKSSTEWYDNGKVKAEIPYNAVGLHGTKKEFSENGKLTEENTYENGKRISYKQYNEKGQLTGAYYWNPSDEKLIKREWYENGKQVRKEEYENGKVKVAKHMDNNGQVTSLSTGGDDGSKKVFYPNGKLKAEHVGELSKHYAEDGKLTEVTLYDGDSHVDSEVKYVSNGKVQELKCGEKASSEKTFKKLCGYEGKYEVTLVGDNGEISGKPTYLNGKVVNTKNYSNGKLTSEVGEGEGVRRSFHPNGNLRGESRYEKERLLMAKYYHENGKLESIQSYDDKGEATSSLQYNERGDLTRLDCKEDAGKLAEFKKLCGFQGPYENFLHASTGEKTRSETMLQGKLKMERFFENGTLVREIPYDGIRQDAGGIDGVEIVYFSDGKLQTQTNYSHGKKKGFSKTFERDGKLRSITFYDDERSLASLELNADGKPVRIQCGKHPLTKDFLTMCGYQGKHEVTLYNATKPSEQVTYENGKLISSKLLSDTGVVLKSRQIAADGKAETLVESYPSGAKKIEKHLDSEGEPTGWVREYAETGQLVKESLHEKGIIASQKEFYLNGNVKKSLTRVKQGDNKFVKYMDYYDNGKVRQTGSLVESHRTADYGWGYFYHYERMREEGLQRTYREDGTLDSELQYRNGELDGICKGYYEDGKTVTQESLYKAGKLVRSTSYDAKGRVLASDEFFADGSRKSLMKK